MIGTEIGTFRIIDKIGDGGMGVVYKAVDTQLDRVVAVKALSPEFTANASLVDRFRSEARAQAQLNHPNLATLYAFLVHEGIAYMVMEYVDGETFHSIISRRGAIPAAEALPLFRQALAGIGHAHRMGIVHRDIKPSNIMLNRDGIVKVMDFGLAKVAGNHGATRTGVRLGTAYYMSPEQVLAKPVDARSDIYSLAATLYEMLTGRVPFHADSEYEILNDHVRTPPPPPTRFDPRIPQHIEKAVLTALAKDPAERFQTTEQFSAALEQPESFYAAKTVVDTAPIVTPAVRLDKAGFWTKGRMIPVAAAGALICLVAAFLTLRPKPEPSAIVRVPAPTAAPPVVPAPAPAKPAPFPTTAPPPKTEASARVTIPAGTGISVVTNEVINPYANLAAQYKAELTAPLTVDGQEIFPQGAGVVLQLAEIANEDHPGKQELALRLVSIVAGGHTIAMNGSAPLPKTGNFLERKLHKNRVPAGTSVEFKLSQRVMVPIKTP